MAAALPPVAGNGHQLSVIQPKLAGCSQRLEANAKQQSFHFQWAITQQHLGKGPCETSQFFFIFYKAVVITSIPASPSPPTPLMGSKHEGHSYLLCWFRARNRNFSHPPPPSSLCRFLFANDVEIRNHFVFSVIMNIWCVPSGHVVVWWAWPWLLVKKKRHINVQAGLAWAIFARLVMYKYFETQELTCVNGYFLYFYLVVWTFKKKSWQQK